MSSDAFERIFKLWISLWELVLNEKRSLEVVCTTLQKLVFEFKGYPKFKNWQAICNLGEKEPGMMMVLATLDIEENDDLAKQIIATFPEYFCSEKTNFPIPWTALVQKAKVKGDRDGCVAIRPVIYDAVYFFGIPHEGFVFEVSDVDRLRLPALPVDFPRNGLREWDLKTVLRWRGKDFVIVDIDDDEVWVAPAECFDLNI
ncbi:MAG: hypothetical protein A2114_02410 [Candidatus Vogelbacteria bacterium GWA1_51_14]|uniref:Uncharacterized protein n=1 Tax=Candidatus Vogelbacteria bacterium GWA1_51_14 TaxID=1802435 RepID=A0A1G2QC66_9BACT|nr:MAG: hypothetical protein A2114_02410 [Candidatus Vogelbacteria bacterium GWA1_51_14]